MINLRELDQKSFDAYLEFCVTSSMNDAEETARVLRAGANPDHIIDDERTNAHYSLFSRATHILHQHGSPSGMTGRFPDKLKKWQLLLDFGANPNHTTKTQMQCPLYVLTTSANFDLRSKTLFAQTLLNAGALITYECLHLMPRDNSMPLQQRVQQAGTPRTVMQSPDDKDTRPTELIQLRHANAQQCYKSLFDTPQGTAKTDISAHDVILLANIGRHIDVFDPARWNHQPDKALDLITQLPQWMQRTIIEAQAWLSPAPSNVITTPSHHVHPSPTQRGAA